MPFFIFPALVFITKKILEAIEEDNYKPPPEPIIENIICLIGSTNSGKSSTANALLGKEVFKTGIEHGVTTTSLWINYVEDYIILDTPGLFDSTNYEWEAITQARRSRIIVYVASGQLYQPELDFIDKLKTYYLKSHTLLLFINKEDEKENYMPKAQRQKEKELIINQVANWIPKEQIAFGSSSPKEKGIELSSRIDDLENLIDKYM